MTEVVLQEYEELISQHHKSECETKAATDSQFDEKVKFRAYEIWLETSRSDERTNYYQAMEEIRKRLCDCSDFSRQYLIVEPKQHASNTQLNQEKINSIHEDEEEEEQKQNEEEHISINGKEEEKQIDDALPSLVEQINRPQQYRQEPVEEEQKPSEKEDEPQTKEIVSEDNLPSLMDQINKPGDNKEEKKEETSVKDEEEQNQIETPIQETQVEVEGTLPSLMNQINEPESIPTETKNESETIKEDVEEAQSSTSQSGRLPSYDEKIEFREDNTLTTEEPAEEKTEILENNKSKKKKKGKK